MFEASVGGGIPIIRPLVQCLTADVIEEVSGILNGTTNYMLTRMKEEGISFEEADVYKRQVPHCGQSYSLNARFFVFAFL